jgi:hypothetical protein
MKPLEDPSEFNAALLAACSKAPGKGCRSLPRDSNRAWCDVCRARETLSARTAGLNQARETIRRLNRRCQVAEAAAGKNAWTQRGRRVATFVWDELKRCQAELSEVKSWQWYLREDSGKADRRSTEALGVYLVRCGDFIKIGMSQDVRARVSGFNDTLLPTPAYPIGFIRCESIDIARQREKELHARFSGLRQRGEWFSVGDDLLDFAESLNGSWPT